MRRTKGTLAGLLVIAAVAAVPSSAMAWPHVTAPWTTTTTTTTTQPDPPTAPRHVQAAWQVGAGAVPRPDVSRLRPREA
jgi:hypothetical protein